MLPGGEVHRRAGGLVPADDVLALASGFLVVECRFAEPVVRSPADVHMVLEDGDEQAAFGVVLVAGRHEGEAGALQVEPQPGREGFECRHRQSSSFLPVEEGGAFLLLALVVLGGLPVRGAFGVVLRDRER
ncbi:hypothetical protein QFZ22_000333 [Streptomyces canus]|uniref:Uncharacterized protein n=1 Tax=Streptomyces canus TaxID=58343 RepID=A0AAW8F3I5_9ACTN|nr:hypothetical protein [Streptomyces canus]MDQ0904348.1 hypothetical protein [Streptomyces canus]